MSTEPAGSDPMASMQSPEMMRFLAASPMAGEHESAESRRQERKSKQ
jgi:hypothetical protein